MSAFRVGVIGAGAVFRRLYAPAFAQVDGMQLVSVADPVRPGVPDATAHATPEAMLDAEQLDGVIVLSPPPLHAAQVALCAERGLRVLVEKPPALTTAEVDAWPRPELITPAFSRRYDARYPRGDKRGYRWQFTLQTNPASWGALRVEPVERDLLPHVADLAGWLTGESIAATQDIRRGRGMAAGTFELSDGGRFSWEVCHGATHIERLTLDGKELVTERISLRERARLRITRGPAAEVVGISRLLRDWLAAQHGSATDSMATVADARACAAVIEAVERAPIGGD